MEKKEIDSIYCSNFDMNFEFYGCLNKMWSLQSLSVNNFYVGEGSDSTGVPTKMLTMNGTLKINVYNPATLFGIHVSSTPINLVYSEIVIATGQVTNLQTHPSINRLIDYTMHL